MKKVLIIIVSVMCMGSLLVCGGSKSSDTDSSEESSDTKKVSLKTREGMEKKLQELGIDLFPGAAFKENSYKAGSYKIIYALEMNEETKKKAADFYKKMAEKLTASGWKSKNTHGLFDYWLVKGSDNVTISHQYNPKYKYHHINLGYQKLR